MANKIGNLVTVLSVRSKPFRRGLLSAQKMLTGFARGIGRSIVRIGALGAAMSALVAGGGFVYLLKRSMEAIDATAKLADNLGFAVEKLTAYQHGAKLAGMADKELSTGLRRLQKNISDATLGLTTAQRAFDALGISAADLIGMSTDQAFEAVADSVSKIDNQFTRARVAQDLFGRSGLSMLKFLEKGSAGLDAMRKEAKRLGITFSRLDAARVEQANDAIADLRAAIGGLVGQMAIKLAPSITSAAHKLTSMFTEGTSAADKMEAVFIRIGSTLAALGDMVRDTHLAFNGLVAGAYQALADLASLHDKQIVGNEKFGIKWNTGWAGDARKLQDAAQEWATKQIKVEQELRPTDKFQQFLSNRLAGTHDATDNKTPGGLGAGMGGDSATSRVGDFKQIVRSLYGAGGMGARRQPIQADPQELSLLERIARNTEGARAA